MADEVGQEQLVKNDNEPTVGIHSKPQIEKAQIDPKAKDIIQQAQQIDSPHEVLEELSKEEPEDIEQRKAQIMELWSAWGEIKNVPELVALFDRKGIFPDDIDPDSLLKQYGFPERSRISDLKFETWTVNLDPKFVKDGFIYLLRGDHPGQEKKGFYSRPYGYAKQTTEHLAHALRSSGDVDYFIWRNEVYLTDQKVYSKSIAEQLAYDQSRAGQSTFISTTVDLDRAIAGTGNEDDEDQKVYILKLPVDSVINSNTGDYFGFHETEYLVPDYIAPSEIVASFPRDQRDAVYQYMNDAVGVSKEDLGYGLR